MPGDPVDQASDGLPDDTRSLDTHRSPERVREVYDRIASHFSKTRAYPWPEVEAFLEDTTEGGNVGLDVGCGNGRHTELLAEECQRVVGLELSRSLLGEAVDNVLAQYCAWVQGDAATLPIATDSINVAIYVATLHHLPDRETRVESLRELDRVLQPGASALVSAWSTAHDRFEAEADAEEGFDTTIDWTLPGGQTLDRFYHIYAPAEFERDLEASGLTVEDSFLSSGNCYAVVVPDSQ